MISKIAKQLTYIIATIIILAALLVSAGRLMTPLLNDHLPNFEAWSSQVLHVPVKIKHVEIVWNVYEPELAFDRVTILDTKTLQPKFAIQQIRVNLNILYSLIFWKPVTQSIKITGSHLTIRHPVSNKIFIDELKNIAVIDTSVGSTSQFSDVLAWIFSQPSLILEDFDIDYHSPNGTQKSFSIEKLFLQNKSSRHKLYGDIVFHQDISTRFSGKMLWTGDVTDLEHVNANLYFYGEAVALPEWISQFSWNNLKINQGLGSAKVWMTWNHNQFQKIQTQVQFYDVELASLITHQIQKLQRISGQFRWERQGEKIILAGREILINLPDHLWPTTYFNAILRPNKEGFQKFESLSTGFFDVKDTVHWILKSGLAADEINKQLVLLSPTGEIRQLNLEMPNSIQDLSTLKLNIQFARLSFHSVSPFPGAERLRGTFDWNNAQGNLNLQSYRTNLIIPQLFLNPLVFDQLQGQLQVHKKEKGDWFVSLNNFKAQNADLKAGGSLLIENGSIDLSAKFSMLNVSHIANYLPVKKFNPDLGIWLKKAFESGMIDHGQATVKGQMKDFPFESGNGKFLISGDVKDANLKFAPQWPALEHVNGVLTFSGAAMNAQVARAEILHVPVEKIQAIIPYIGERAPQVLYVNGQIHSDFSHLMNFIQQSPLQHSIGKSLSILDMKGLMKLQLGLTIPLRTPENTKVAGDLQAFNAKLDLPINGLMLEQINGMIHFTEDTVQANHLAAKILNNNATLAIQTHQENKTNIVQVNLDSRVAISNLENWLKIPIKNYVSGSTDYHAQFFLTSYNASQPSRFSIQSDLKGVAISLPEPYDKNANENVKLQADVILPRDRPLVSKIKYDKGISAILSFQKNANAWKLLSGELHFGPGEPQLPSQSGLIVSAQFDQVSWDKLVPYYDWVKSKKAGESEGIFRRFILNANQASCFGQTLEKLHLEAEKTKNQWNLDVNSVQLNGKFNVAPDFSRIQANLSRLYVRSNAQSNGEVINPKSLPAINLTVDNLQYDDMRLGRVYLNSIKIPNGLKISDFQINSNVYHVQANGSWLAARSYLNGSLSTARLSDMLAQWKINSAALIAGDGEAHFDLNWPGAIFHPTLKNLSGNVDLKLGAGRIINLGNSVEAKLGFGRLLNLLSFKGDLFQNGYSFDSVKGNFKLQNGNAYTTDMKIEGTVASIAMIGRIGLAAKDYDLQLGIMAHVTSSLPFIVGAATLNPIAGVATWAVDKLVSGPVSKVTSYNYRITGTWDNPRWSQVNSRGEAP